MEPQSKDAMSVESKETKPQNKMGFVPVKKIVWQMGLPMIVSMVLQALYNIVDTAFVINMKDVGSYANLALTYAFPVQIFMIAIGVGTGIGINALLSERIGKRDREGASRACYNGIFLGFIFFLVFLLFGLFGARPFIAMQANGITDSEEKELVVEMGNDYLFLCCVFSFGQMMYTVFERFLQASGRTVESMIGQISGALLNILLDYVLIYPAGLGVAGAAIATVIGQFVSFLVDATFHFIKDKEVDNKIKYLKPDGKILGAIFRIGIPAMVMQALLSLMMLGVNLLLSFAPYDVLTLQGSFGIYYKIQQIPLFACFGMSNALISLTSFNAGIGDEKRVKEIKKYGLLDTVLVALILTILFEALADPIAKLFGFASGESSSGVVLTTVYAVRIASLGYPFMAYSVAGQGVLQGLRRVFSPLLISFLRLVIFLFPFILLFSHLENATMLLWISFPIAEFLTALVTFFLIGGAFKKRKKANKVQHIKAA